MKSREKTITIALAGNPNSGKSTLFNALTGSRQHVANYPGITVEKKTGWFQHREREIHVVDLPGIYSLSAYSIEEVIAREFLINESPDLVVDIVDASNLERNLYLTVQLLELGSPLILALNMMDMAEAMDIRIDTHRLSELLGVPVVGMVARNKRGIDELMDLILDMSRESPKPSSRLISYGRDLDEAIEKISQLLKEEPEIRDRYPIEWFALKCVERDKKILKIVDRLGDRGRKIREIVERVAHHIRITLEEDPESIIADYRYGYIAGIIQGAVKRKSEFRLNLSDKLDKVLTHRFIGPLFMLFVIYLMYDFTFWASQAPLELLDKTFSVLGDIVNRILPEGDLRSLIISGIIDGVGGVLGFVPIIVFMFFSIAVLEDTGYMARMAYMMDRVLRWFGLHGNSMLALIIGGGISGGCAVPGVLATRTLKDTKERIATILVVPFMNCGAKLPIYALFISAFFENQRAKMMFIITMISWVFSLISAKIIRVTVLRGPSTPFVMELPPYRAPTLKGLLIHTWERTWQYIKKAGTIILAISIVMWALLSYPKLPEGVIKSYETKRLEIVKDSLRKIDIAPDIKVRLREYLLRYAKGGPLKERPENIGIKDPEIEAALYRCIEKLNSSFESEAQNRIRYTIAGRIGSFFERFTRYMGFDYRVNIALIGGVTAKEVIVSTLAIAFSLGDEENSNSLPQSIRNDPFWNPLLSFTLLIFVMLYVPCLATLIVMKMESGWKWVAFSIFYSLTIASVVSLIVFNMGRLFHLGI